MRDEAGCRAICQQALRHCPAEETLVRLEGTRAGVSRFAASAISQNVVTEEWKLRDGQIVCIEGVQYMYLRGSRK